MVGHMSLEVICDKYQVQKFKTSNETLIVEFISKLRHLYVDDVSVDTSMTVTRGVELSCLTAVIWYQLRCI